MKILHVILLSIIMLLIGSAQSHAQTTKTKIEHPPNGRNSPYAKSLTELLSNPQYYNDEPVQITGFLNLGFEGDALYINKDDCKEHRFDKAVWVHLNHKTFNSASIYNKHYVIIEAVFDGNDHGHMGVFAGALKRITSVKITNERTHRK